MKYSLSLFAILLAIACQPTGAEKEPTVEKEVPEALPMQVLALSDLSDFKPTGANWSIAGRALSDHQKSHDMQTFDGTGVLVNQNSETAKENLFTAWEHGDIELDIEFMTPKGSNSGIYFQGRYEIQLLDSWQVKEPQHSDCGGLYQRWDESKPEGEKGFEGRPPRINAAKAPGLWQHFHIVFRAPRFDKNGQKVENARFEKVVHNGITIHENVEATGPTRAAAFEDEAALGPLMIQGDHGPVAFRNIKYKLYFDQGTLTLDDLRYKYYEVQGPITQLPDFDTLTAVREGTTDSLVFEKLSERQEEIAYIFNGKLKVAKGGDYLFHCYSDDGSQLFINGEMLIDNDGKHDFEPKRGLIRLEEGSYDFELRYFNYTWGRGLMVMYEGPELRKQSLYSRTPDRNGRSQAPKVLVEAEEAPEMVRSFVMHGDEKINHAISVGHPQGLHYSFDLRRGALLKFWKGGFADVTNMWFGRGISQLLIPQTMAVENPASPIAAVLDKPEAPYPVLQTDALLFKGYDINAQDQPVYRYLIGETAVLDHYQPSEDGQELIRTLKADNGRANLYSRIAASEYIQEVGNGYYSVGGNYYLNLKNANVEPLIREKDGKTEMLFPLDASNEIQYAILW